MRLRLLSILLFCCSFWQSHAQSYKPLGMLDPELAGQNINWNYNMGYRFKATADGYVTHIGGKWRTGISHKVRLFKYPSGLAIDSFDVTGTGDWKYLDIADIQLEEDSQYVVAVRLNAKSSGMYSWDVDFPVENGGIIIQGGSIIDSTDAMPRNLLVNRAYGFADIIFEPCSYAGTIEADKNSILQGDSAELRVKQVTGPIQWQRSIDNNTFSNIQGEVSALLRTGPSFQTTYYRTILNTGTCVDTSEVYEVNVLDPNFPLRSLNPRVWNQDINWNYNMGYRFTCESDGYVTKLGGRWRDGAEHVVRLYDDSSAQVLASAQVKGSMKWNYEDINPVQLKKGKTYVVAVRLTEPYSGTYAVMDMPVSSGGIVIESGTYRWNSNLMPTNTISRLNYGNADIKFEPCVFAGKLVADENSISVYDSTTIRIVEHNGSLTWQKSSDGINYSTIVGQNDSTLNTGSFLEDTWYRTISSNACGTDTSAPIIIYRYYPGYLLQSCKPQTISRNVNWNYNMGFRFTPQVNGQITELGGDWSDGVTHKVHLFDYSSGNPIDSFTVTGNGKWNYIPITPINLNANQTYVFTVRLNAQRSGVYGRLRFPITKSNVLIHGATFIDSTSAMPTNLIRTLAYGYADLRFEPCVYAGDIYCEDTLVCSGTNVALQVKDTEGSIQWQVSNNDTNYSSIAGAIDSVLNQNINATSYYRVISSTACGDDTSEVFKIRVPGPGGQHGKWLGHANSNWFDVCNWDDGIVPTAGDSVYIGESEFLPVNIPNINLDYLELDDGELLILMNDLEIKDELNLISGSPVLNGTKLTLGANASIKDNYSLAYVKMMPGSEFTVKLATSAGQIDAPIGTLGSYSPVKVNLISSSLGPTPSLTLRTFDSTHHQLNRPGNYLNKFWRLEGLDVSNPTYTVELTYDASDVVGGESALRTHFWNGTGWSQYDLVNASNNSLLTSSGVTGFGDFTGFDREAIISSQSGNWGLSTTWVGGVVPTNIDNAIVRNGHTVSLNQSSLVGSIEVENGGSFNTNSNNIDIEGNIRSEGNINLSGRVIMQGNSTQQLDLNNLVQIDTLIIDNADGVELISGAIDISGKLSIESGEFVTNDSLRLLGDTNWTASLGQVKGSISGKIFAQRSIPGTGSKVGYRHFSSPVQNTRLADLMYDQSSRPNGIYFYGIPGSNMSWWNWPNAYTFNEINAGLGVFDDGWTAATHVDNKLNYQNPYTIYTGGVNFPSYELEVYGYPYTGEFQFNDLSYTGSLGWHFIGNPYPSAIDWSAVSKTNVNANAYVFSTSTGGYVSTNLLSPANQIASFQAFFVRVSSGTNNITFEESDKVEGSPDFRKKKPQQDRLYIELRNKDNGLYSPAAIDWKNGASLGFDGDFDAYKLSNPSPLPNLGLSFDSLNDVLQVNAVSEDQYNLSFELLCQSEVYGNFELYFDMTDSSNACWLLTDKQLDSVVDLKQMKTYSFKIDSNSIEDRFMLNIHNFSRGLISNATSCFERNDGEIELKLIKGLNQKMEWFDMRGKSLGRDTSSMGAYLIDSLMAGEYLIELRSDERSCVNSDFQVRLEQPEEVAAKFTVARKAEVGEVLHFLNMSKGTDRFMWNFGDGESSSSINPNHEYHFPGNYTIYLAAGNKDCADTSSMEISISSSLGSIEPHEEKINIRYLNGMLYLNSKTFMFSKLKISDALGRQIALRSFEENLNEAEIPMKLSSGVYFVELSGPEGVKGKKLAF